MGKNECFELESLKIATLILAALSIGIFLIQRLVVTIFEPAFEICIFHLSTLVSLTAYLWRRRKLKDPRKVQP